MHARSLQMPSLKPVGHQSTNWMVRLVLMVATAALTSLGTTSVQWLSCHTAREKEAATHHLGRAGRN
jgi:hypothetical protein